MFTIESYRATIQENLEKHTAMFVGELNKIMSYRFDPDVDLLDFTIYTDTRCCEISIMMFSMAEDANEVFSEDRTSSNFAGSIEVLPTVAYHPLPDHQLHDFWAFYEKNEAELVSKEQQIFTDWFIECWDNAGGSAFHMPAYFEFHDEGSSYDLQNNRVIDSEEKWVHL